jgi:hypothetical protein
VTKVSLRRLPDGGFELRDWPRWGSELLEHLTTLADPDPGDDVKERLYPPPTDDEKRAAEWKRAVQPELFALIASAREVVLADLAKAKRAKLGGIKELVIPKEHVRAWISALNVARLHLATTFDVDAGAMRAPPDELTPDMRGPVELIDFYGWMQGWMVEAAMPEEPPPAAPPGPRDVTP